MYALNEPAFRNEEEAYRFVEARVWPDGPVCPHCGRGDRIGRLMGKDPKPGAYKCYACRKPFNVKLGTMLESTHVPLHLWLQALFLLHAAETPVSVNRLHQILGVSSRTSWLMSQRFRDRLATAEAEAQCDEDARMRPRPQHPYRDAATFGGWAAGG
ncbi:transposase [Salinarimonas sp.]|uniref:transposase n=1 Tax=Salinarimonas sp. TaxID=2766526 RepID=UPI0032D8BF63